jgi:hypothetical protein
MVCGTLHWHFSSFSIYFLEQLNSKFNSRLINTIFNLLKAMVVITGIVIILHLLKFILRGINF